MDQSHQLGTFLHASQTMASKPVPYCPTPANSVTSPEASQSPVKHSKTSKVKMPPGPSPRDQDSLGRLAKQPPGNTGPGPSQPRTCYHLNLCPLPSAQLLAAESPIPFAMPEATGVCLPEGGSTEQLQDKICTPRESLNLTPFPPEKPPSDMARRPKGRTPHRSKKKCNKEVLGFSINLVLSDSDPSAPDIPGHLPIPEATEVTIPVNPH